MYIRQEWWVTVTKFTPTEPYYTEYSETIEVYSQHKTMTLMVDRSSFCKTFRLYNMYAYTIFAELYDETADTFSKNAHSNCTV